MAKSLNKNPLHSSPDFALAGWISPIRAAGFLGFSKSQIYKLMGSGDLPAKRVGGSTRISMQSLRDFMERQPDRARGRWKGSRAAGQ